MNSVTFIIFEAICCPNLDSFVKEISSNCCDVAIVSIICVTVCGTLLTICIKMFAYLKERLSSEADKKTIADMKKLIDDLKAERDTIKNEKDDVEKNFQLEPEQKEMNRFLDFCYEMAKSTAMADQTIKKECWDILKKRYPIETKKENEN